MSKAAAGQETAEEYVSLNQFATFETPGDMVAGILIGQQDITLADGKIIAQFAVLSDSGLEVFNESFQLSVLRRVPVGSRIRVTYTGEGPRSSRGNPVKQFDVQVLKADFEQFARTLQAAPVPALAVNDDDGFADPFSSQ